MSFAEAFDSVPKAELHLHLEGTIRPDTTIELAARHGVHLTSEEVALRYAHADFAGFIETFKWVTSFLRDPADYAVITRKMCAELARQNVVYAEVTISAGVMLLRKQDVEANFAAIAQAASAPPCNRVRIGWIFDCVRQFGSDAAMEVARWAARLRPTGVIAFGMGGDELSLPTADFRQAFSFAREKGLRLVCHAGEIGGPNLVREAVETLGAERIGHGLAVMHDPALGESLAEREVVLENCPTSNLFTGALAKQLGRPAAHINEHPLRTFVEHNWPVTLSTDDPGLFHTDLANEYACAASLGLSKQQLVHVAEQSFCAAFLPAPDKRELLENFRAAAKSAALL
jgi:aminodeoxyfutalosine deaminase